MAFHTNSRYYGQPTVEVEHEGRTVTALRLRSLSRPSSEPVPVCQHDRLDLLAHENYQDATRFWYIADANAETEANQLLERLAENEPRIIQLPGA